jgi:hypothetical protein
MDEASPAVTRLLQLLYIDGSIVQFPAQQREEAKWRSVVVVS